jgi:hypothetical protein
VVSVERLTNARKYLAAQRLADDPKGSVSTGASPLSSVNTWSVRCPDICMSSEARFRSAAATDPIEFLLKILVDLLHGLVRRVLLNSLDVLGLRLTMTHRRLRDVIGGCIDLVHCAGQQQHRGSPQNRRSDDGAHPFPHAVLTPCRSPHHFSPRIIIPKRNIIRLKTKNLKNQNLQKPTLIPMTVSSGEGPRRPTRLGSGCW